MHLGELKAGDRFTIEKDSSIYIKTNITIDGSSSQCVNLLTGCITTLYNNVVIQLVNNSIKEKLEKIKESQRQLNELIKQRDTKLVTY